MGSERHRERERERKWPIWNDCLLKCVQSEQNANRCCIEWNEEIYIELNVRLSASVLCSKVHFQHKITNALHAMQCKQSVGRSVGTYYLLFRIRIRMFDNRWPSRAQCPFANHIPGVNSIIFTLRFPFAFYCLLGCLLFYAAKYKIK